ncbi:hypothetical protein [Luteibacter sp.]|uniref:hypothetical protein n=1 Tax=Luteibacter sp. TaxID=1886636 RepID=UPI0025BF203C|nr:hypothetical protein [Luteibacter sp.]
MHIHPWISPLANKWALILGFAGLALIFLTGALLKPTRVGDGSEYYALYYAIKVGHHPFMTEPAYVAYDKLVASGTLRDAVATQTMRDAFPPLIQKSGADYNHFWFYPALAVVAGGWLSLFGAGAHLAFIFLHALLFGALIYVSARAYGRIGAFAAAVVTIGSPMIWFVDKVHTEFLTYCCVAIAAVVFSRRSYFVAALMLAIASTQNISIGATSVFLLAIAAWKVRKEPIKFSNVVLAVTTLALIALHPLYFFTRIGVIDPQLLAGGSLHRIEYR